MLWEAAMVEGFGCPIWMTYKQAQETGGQVRKGERGSKVVYANTFKTEAENIETGETEEIEVPFLKEYTVFNCEQIDGLPEHYYHKPEAPALPAPERIEHAERFLEATGAEIQNGGNRAFYAVDLDFIRVPHIETFRDATSYYATLTHELTHWTRRPSRLDRSFGRKRWGDEGYAREELVAELGVLGATEQKTGLRRIAAHLRPLSRLVLLDCAAAVVRPDSRILGL
jgi:antirestriction protein ArdC